MFQKLLRIYSYLFAFASGAAYLGLGIVSKVLGQPLTLDNMPWKGDELTIWMLGIGLLGIASAVLAAIGSRLRFLLPVYMALQLYITIKGNFLGAHAFDGQPDFQRTLIISAGSVLAFLCSLLQFKRRASVPPATGTSKSK